MKVRELWGRPIQPLPLALTVASSAVAVADLAGGLGDPVDIPFLGDAVGLVALVVAFTFIAGWLSEDARFTRAGYLLATGLWASRAILLWLEEGLWFYGLWLAVAWCIAAGGAYWLEERDPR